MSSGRVFQTRGPATVKARLPTVESLTGGTSRGLVMNSLVKIVKPPCVSVDGNQM